MRRSRILLPGCNALHDLCSLHRQLLAHILEDILKGLPHLSQVVAVHSLYGLLGSLCCLSNLQQQDAKHGSTLRK